MERGGEVKRRRRRAATRREIQNVPVFAPFLNTLLLFSFLLIQEVLDQLHGFRNQFYLTSRWDRVCHAARCMVAEN